EDTAANGCENENSSQTPHKNPANPLHVPPLPDSPHLLIGLPPGHQHECPSRSDQQTAEQSDLCPIPLIPHFPEHIERVVGIVVRCADPITDDRAEDDANKHGQKHHACQDRCQPPRCSASSVRHQHHVSFSHASSCPWRPSAREKS